MGQAEVISLSEVRATKQWASLRHQLHERFDQWLDRLEAQLPEPERLCCTNRVDPALPPGIPLLADRIGLRLT
jgi:hypothetical protein